MEAQAWVASSSSSSSSKSASASASVSTPDSLGFMRPTNSSRARQRPTIDESCRTPRCARRPSSSLSLSSRGSSLARTTHDHSHCRQSTFDMYINTPTPVWTKQAKTKGKRAATTTVTAGAKPCGGSPLKAGASSSEASSSCCSVASPDRTSGKETPDTESTELTELTELTDETPPPSPCVATKPSAFRRGSATERWLQSLRDEIDAAVDEPASPDQLPPSDVMAAPRSNELPLPSRDSTSPSKPLLRRLRGNTRHGSAGVEKEKTMAETETAVAEADGSDGGFAMAARDLAPVPESPAEDEELVTDPSPRLAAMGRSHDEDSLADVHVEIDVHVLPQERTQPAEVAAHIVRATGTDTVANGSILPDQQPGVRPAERVVASTEAEPEPGQPCVIAAPLQDPGRRPLPASRIGTRCSECRWRIKHGIGCLQRSCLFGRINRYSQQVDSCDEGFGT